MTTPITIKRGVKHGINFVTFYDDGLEEDDLLVLSEKLTGTHTPIEDRPLTKGIFTCGMKGAHNKIVKVKFHYGYCYKTFDFPVIDFERDDVLTIEQSLRNRIEQVIEWRTSVDFEEALSFVV
jgi:hypothetical protein